MTIKNYSYFYVFLGIFAYMQADGVDLPSANQLQKILNEKCHEKICLINSGPAAKPFSQIMSCCTKLEILKQHPHSKPSMSKTGGIEPCSTVKCQMMRLYYEISFAARRLTNLLSTEDKIKLRALNDEIHNAKNLLIKHYGFNEKDFTTHPNMLFL